LNGTLGLKKKNGLLFFFSGLMDSSRCLLEMLVQHFAVGVQDLFLSRESFTVFLGTGFPCPVGSVQHSHKIRLIDFEVGREQPTPVCCPWSTKGVFKVPRAQQGSKNDHL
jgi:hypothetical protein